MAQDELEGHWWLPDTPDRRRFGRLRVDDPTGAWRLEIEGGVRTPVDATSGSAIAIGQPAFDRYEVVHGDASDGTAISVLHPHGPRSWMPGEPTREIWRFSSYATGHEHIRPPDLLSELRVRFDDLLAWVGQSWPNVDHDQTSVTVRHDARNLGETVIAGQTIRLVVDHSWSVNDSGAEVRPYASFRWVSPGGLTFEDAVENIVSPLRDLIAFFTLGRTGVERVDAALQSEPTGGRNRAWLRFHVQYQAPDQPHEPKHHYDMLAPLGLIPLAFDELIERWLSARTRFRKTVDLLLLPQRARYLYADDKVSTAVQAVDAYHAVAIGGTSVDPAVHETRVAAIVAGAPEEHKAWARERLSGQNQKGQKRRIEEVIDRAGATGAAVVAAVPKFAELANKSRQQVAHPSDDGDGVRFVAVAMGLRWILRHCVLVELGLSDGVTGALVGGRPEFQNELELIKRWLAPDRPSVE